MRKKVLATAAALALIAAACGSDVPAAEPQPELGLVRQGDQGVLQVLSYAYEPDTSLDYAFVMDMDMDMTMDFPGLGNPGEMSMGMSMGTRAGTKVANTVNPETGKLSMVANVELVRKMF